MTRWRHANQMEYSVPKIAECGLSSCGQLARNGTRDSTNVVSIENHYHGVRDWNAGTDWNAMIFIALKTKSDRCRGEDREICVPARAMRAGDFWRTDAPAHGNRPAGSA